MIGLSIIIVSWNAREYLSKCLRSLERNTTHYHFEIIVVDNASSDGSPEYIRQQFPHVKLICNATNYGYSKASNIGISHSEGKYICLINSDVEVLDNYLDKMIAYMEKNPSIGILGPKIVDVKGKIQRSTMRFPTLWNTFCRALALDSLFPKAKLFESYLMRFWQHDDVKSVDVINGCFWMVRRTALKEVGVLDERFFIYGEDIDWCRRFWNARWKVVYFPQAKAIHYGGASSSQAPIRFYIEMHRANLQYWKKHRGRSGQIEFLVIMGLHHILRLFGEMMKYIIKPNGRASAKFKMKKSLACIQWIAGLHY